MQRIGLSKLENEYLIKLPGRLRGIYKILYYRLDIRWTMDIILRCLFNTTTDDLTRNTGMDIILRQMLKTIANTWPLDE